MGPNIILAGDEVGGEGDKIFDSVEIDEGDECAGWIGESSGATAFDFS